MEAPQNETNIPQEQENKKKRSPWLIVLLILLILMMGCCIIGAILCRGSRWIPDILDRYLRDVPGLESGELDFWGLVEEFADPENFDPDNFDPENFFPEDFLPEGSDDGVFNSNICNGLSGNFEMQILVGPSDAVGLEPFGVGFIPFTVEFDQDLYLVKGEGTIDYEDVLEFQGGTFTVFFDMLGKVDGVCTQEDNGGVLDFTFEMTGDQVFIVDTGNMQTEYPKSFEDEFDYSFPVVDGATESGNEWALILHLD
jgi:hypothetical protein